MHRCPDNRIRRRDCKHIRLILQELGCEDDAEFWYERMLHSLIKHQLPHLSEAEMEERKALFKQQRDKRSVKA